MTSQSNWVDLLATQPMNVTTTTVDTLSKLGQLPLVVQIYDHLGGYDQNLHNDVLYYIDKQAQLQQTPITVKYHQILDDTVRRQYKNLKMDYNWNAHYVPRMFSDYRVHPEINHNNFLCSFNGHSHISRKFLVAALKKFGWFDNEYCTKNFNFTVDELDGHIHDYVGDQDCFFRKFFIDTDNLFFSTINSFGHEVFRHDRNIYKLEKKITQSFLHIVGETIGTSYYPYVTEKSFYSIVTRGLFLTYGQPEWHNHFEQYYGFKKYTKIFDYTFDTIKNPVNRLIELLSMISKFSNLSTDDWHDLYQMEYDTIEHNYHNYFSGNYAKLLQQYDSKFQ
jgi:hypothetical protein